MSELNTIRGTARRARDEGIPIPESALRRWVRSGELPYVRSGNRVYLSWSRVLDFVSCDGSQRPQQHNDSLG